MAELPRRIDARDVREGQFVHIEELAMTANEANEHYLGEVLPSPERHIFIDDLIRDEGDQRLPMYDGLIVTLIKENPHGD